MLNKENQTLDEILSKPRPKTNKSADLFTTTSSKENPIHTCYWVDGLDHLNLPTVIIPSQNDFDTLFADIATYHTNFSPISAYTHIINESTANIAKLDAYRKSKQNLIFSEKVTSAIIGMTIGEALTASAHPTKNPPSSAGYFNCKKTLSYTIARARALYPDYNITDISNRWTKIQELSGNHAPSKHIKATIKAFSLLKTNSIKNRPNNKTPEDTTPLYLYINQLITDQDFSKSLTNNYPEIKKHVSSLGEAFDGRANALEEIIKTVSSKNSDQEQEAVCIAFFCNSILPGSLSHSGILAKLISNYPSILFWYGLFSGLSQDFKWQTTHNGLGSKIIRDLSRPFSFENRPDSDISYEEFEVLSRLPLKATIIKPSHRRSILVSILPGVDIYTDLAIEESAYRENNHYRDTEQKVTNDKIRSLLFSALDLLEKNKQSRDPR